MKKLILICVLVFATGINYLLPQQLSEPPSYKKVLTPLGNQPNPNTQFVFNITWTEDDVESSKQADLYTGGLFRLDNNDIVTEKNNYLTIHSANCTAIDGNTFYLGTDEGIIVSTNSGDSWLSETDDDIDNLESNEINALLLTSTHFFACTDNGIYISTDDGQSWTQGLSSKNVTSIAIASNNDIFVGVSPGTTGIYKSTDNGNTWSSTGLTISTFCLKFVSSNLLYAGTGNGLRKTTNGGDSWSPILYGYFNPVTAIYIDGNNIYIGTNGQGCRASYNGNDFIEINNGLPGNTTINDFEYYLDKLYAATNQGLFRTNLSYIHWQEKDVQDNIYGSQQTKDKLIKNLLFDTIACSYDVPPYQYSGKGSGTKEDPYQITTIQQLAEINSDLWGDHYWALMNDIDASETRWWNPSIQSNGDTIYGGFLPILGIYAREIDGRGHIIKNLFKGGSGNPIISGPNCLTLKRIGFLNTTFISTEAFLITASSDVNNVTIDECFFDINVSQREDDPYRFYSLKGFKWLATNDNLTIKNTYIRWNLNIKTKGSYFAPFYNTNNRKQNITIENCYVTSNTNYDFETVYPPFDSQGDVRSCFWNIDSIKVTDSLGLGKGLGISTTDMMKRHTYESAGWDFDKIWYIEEGMDYPKLQLFRKPDDVEEISNDIARISPNPATDYIELSIPPLEQGEHHSAMFTGAVVVKIYDVLGVEHPVSFAATPLSEGNLRLDVSSLPAGVYFVRVGGRMLKFVKL